MEKIEGAASAEDIFKSIARLLQKYDSLSPLEGFKDAENPVGHFNDLAEQILQGLNDLFIQSHKENFFWYDCPLTVYKKTLQERLIYLQENGNPSLTLDELLRYDYRVFDVIPLYGQRTLRTDRKDLNQFQSLSYGGILEKDFDSENRKQFAEEVREKFEQDRKKKMLFIQEQLQQQGKMIFKIGHDFELINLPTAVKTVEVAPPHSHIFAKNGFKLFEYLLENHTTEERGRQSDIAYYFRQMKSDSFISSDITTFTNWFNSHYQENLGQLKTPTNIKEEDRKDKYSRAIEWLKKQ